MQELPGAHQLAQELIQTGAGALSAVKSEAVAGAGTIKRIHRLFPPFLVWEPVSHAPRFPWEQMNCNTFVTFNPWYVAGYTGREWKRPCEREAKILAKSL